MNRRMRLFLFIALVAAFAAGLVYHMHRDQPVSVVRGQILMNTLVEITVVGSPHEPLDAWIDSAFLEIARIERFATDYDSTSPVGRLNDAGTLDNAPGELLILLARANRFTQVTDGAFDVTTGTATSIWRVAEEHGILPSRALLVRATAGIGPEHMRLDASTGRIMLSPGTRIDLGGIAKGYAVDRALAVLKRLGARGALVNAGGDMAAFGQPPKRNFWRIGIRHPRSGAANYFGIVRLGAEAVATSGDYERGYQIGGVRYNHIIDPASGRPATRLVSATIMAHDAETADVLATAAFVLGPDSGRAMLERIPNAAGLLVIEAGSDLIAYPTRGFLDHATVDTALVELATPLRYATLPAQRDTTDERSGGRGAP